MEAATKAVSEVWGKIKGFIEPVLGVINDIIEAVKIALEWLSKLTGETPEWLQDLNQLPSDLGGQLAISDRPSMDFSLVFRRRRKKQDA